LIISHWSERKLLDSLARKHLTIISLSSFCQPAECKLQEYDQGLMPCTKNE
jgi:hypothetical protein